MLNIEKYLEGIKGIVEITLSPSIVVKNKQTMVHLMYQKGNTKYSNKFFVWTIAVHLNEIEAEKYKKELENIIDICKILNVYLKTKGL